MAKPGFELAPVQIKRLAAVDGFHAVGGVTGLYLQVRGNAASWILRIMVGGKRRDIGLGGYPDVTLAAARENARATRAAVREGRDPVAERRAKRHALLNRLTFTEAAKLLIDAKRPEWKNAKHADQWGSTLDTYAKPVIGAMPVEDIDTPHILRVLEPIWTTKTETAYRVRGRIESVLDWATAAKYRSGDNPARWRGHLDKLLPKPSKVKKVRHHAALPYDALPEFLVALRAQEGIAARALEFAILTAARSGEIRGAKWSEIDTEAKVWTVPGDRMKAGREHRVPLSAPALALLEVLPKFVGNDLVFVAPNGGQLSDMALSQVVRRMKVSAVPHGFRSTFRDWTAERTNYPREVAEMALAHTIGDKVEAAYRRGDLFEKRKRMMSDWAKFATAPKASGEVVPIGKKSGTRR